MHIDKKKDVNWKEKQAPAYADKKQVEQSLHEQPGCTLLQWMQTFSIWTLATGKWPLDQEKGKCKDTKLPAPQGEIIFIQLRKKK